MKHKGKGIRPILTILSSRLCGRPTVNSYKAAAMVELLHLATLMHDDVVDEAKKRRGFPTIHKIWKNKTAIIMGDYILSQVLTNLIRLRDFDALDLISDTAKRLSSGEMLQIERSFKKTMSEEQKKEVAPEKQQTEEVKVEAPKQQTFTQEQLDNIIKARLESEKT